MPPISRSLNCFAISILASLFTLYIVDSTLSIPVYFPELTSIAVNASVLSIVINPPHLSHTFLLSAFILSYSNKSFHIIF